jgi:hypothetical protein
MEKRTLSSAWGGSVIKLLTPLPEITTMLRKLPPGKT